MASPTDTDDSTLLQRYASTGDQSAFAELANRYVDFVYAAALRQTGWNTANAADVTQAIFLVFARRAGTVDPKSLSVWLHRVSGYAAGLCFPLAKAAVFLPGGEFWWVVIIPVERYAVLFDPVVSFLE